MADPASMILRPFEKRYASSVAEWVRDDDELFQLAPRTEPPLTSEKVVRWTGPADRPLLLYEESGERPVGYAELNRFPDDPSACWMGHVILKPESRHQGTGLRFIEALVRRAFRRPACRRIVLVVFPENKPAVRCYSRAGFLLIGEEYQSSWNGAQRNRMWRMALDRPFTPVQRPTVWDREGSGIQ